MAIKNVVLSDNQTGDKIYPRTSYDNLDNIPSNLLTNDYLNVGASDTQQPTLGPNVNKLDYWASRTINFNGFKLYFFSGYFNIKKDMFPTRWHDDKRVLFYLPKGILTSDDNVQWMRAAINSKFAQDYLVFRGFADNNTISWEDVNPSTFDTKSLPDNFYISINGMINSHI